MHLQNAEYWIQHLHLTKHVEGGWYDEVYRSSLLLDKEQLPLSFTGKRNCCTHIYFLLQTHDFSAFHRIQSDELWHFYTGDPLVVYEIEPGGKLITHVLGRSPEEGQTLFCVIRAGNWFASELLYGGNYGLAGCTVSPGFDFTDFELAKKTNLVNVYPQHAELLDRLCIEN